MKLRLLTGEDSLLCPPIKAKKDMYPLPVKQLAQKHWNESTIPEPSVQRRSVILKRAGSPTFQAVCTLPRDWRQMVIAYNVLLKP